MLVAAGRRPRLGSAASIVAKELGVSSVDEVFSDFSKEPIDGLLGQVHLGTLKKNGQKVAAKSNERVYGVVRYRSQESPEVV